MKKNESDNRKETSEYTVCSSDFLGLEVCFDKPGAERYNDMYSLCEGKRCGEYS
jgi:hypothetical protein